MGLKYKIQFKTINDADCEVLLDVKDYTGEVIDVVAGGNPFIINTDTSDFLAPVRSSSATLSVCGSDYLQDLYASDPQGVKVTLLVNGSVYWLGFITPDTFSQNFTNSEFIYEIECVAALSTLKYKEFDLTDDFVTFRQIVQNAIGYAGYSDLIFTNTVYAGSTNYFGLKIASANFYDELGDAMTYYEVLEEIAKYAGCCFVPYKDVLYFLDYAAIRSGYASYSKFSGGTVNLSDLKNVTNYKGTDAKISRIAGKNKAVVNCSLYEINNLIPEFNEEGSIFVSSTETLVKTISGKTTTESIRMIRYYGQPRFVMYEYTHLGNNKFTQVETHDPVGEYKLGSMFVRIADYDAVNKPSSLSFTNELLVKMWRSATEGGHLNVSHPILKLVSEKKIITHGELYFCISLDVMISSLPTEIKSENQIYAKSDAVWNVVAKLKIGDKYYDGEKWVNTDISFKMPITFKNGQQQTETFLSLDNTNTFETGIGNLNGYLIKGHDDIMNGYCELTIYAFADAYAVDPDFVHYRGTRHRFKNIKLSYGIPDAQSVYGDWISEDSKNDILYENVIEGGYIDEADEIDLKICTNTDGKLTLSSVVEGNGFLSKLTSDVYGTDVPENLLLKRVIDLFETPRFVIDPVLLNDAEPYARFTEPYLEKQFLVAGGEEDVKMESTRYNLIEL